MADSKKQEGRLKEKEVVSHPDDASPPPSMKSSKSDKKRKRLDDDVDTANDNNATVDSSLKKLDQKKQKKIKKHKKSNDKDTSLNKSGEKNVSSTKPKISADQEVPPRLSPAAVTAATGVDAVTTTPAGTVVEVTPGASKPARFICFIGNLPYSTTIEAVRAHFASLSPIDVRLLTERDNPKKSRGIAFVEFGRYDHMRTCLAKFHHSEYNDGVSPSRRINVELTAGGGGKKSRPRRRKIVEKNQKLNEERARRMKEEEGLKLEREKTNELMRQLEAQADKDIIHPSRRARVTYQK